MTREHFERLYSKEADPWKLVTSGYERAKYVATVEALRKKRFRSIFEDGCSIGLFYRGATYA